MIKNRQNSVTRPLIHPRRPNAHIEPRPQSQSPRTDEMQQSAEKRLRTAPPTHRTPPNIDDGAPPPQRNSPLQKPRPHCSTRPTPEPMECRRAHNLHQMTNSGDCRGAQTTDLSTRHPYAQS